jgi:tetratricopeptide (TPR) repeat protein
MVFAYKLIASRKSQLLAPLRAVTCICFASAVAFSATLEAAPKPKFLFDISGNESTIGDIKPAFIDFGSDPVPTIPIKEIIRRYKQLFDSTDDPVIRIDALWRLNALEQKFGSEKEISAKDEQLLYKRAVESYEALIAMPSPPYPLEQLLYQAAKAYDLTGAQEKSIQSLERLVKRFPKSDLAAEAWFRIGEFQFSNAQYALADQSYQQTAKRGSSTRFYDKALFMSGWARFKADDKDQALESFSQVLDVAYEQDKSLEKLSRLEQETVDDSMRAMSMIFSYADDPLQTARMLHRYEKKPYIHHLYGHLSGFYLEQERYEDSASVNRSFIDLFPNSEWAPVFAARNIETYKQAQFSSKLIAEKRAFVSRYAGKDSKVSGFSVEAKEKLIPYLREYLDDLSHLDYLSAQSEKNREKQIALFQNAAEYYETYAELIPGDKESGVKLFLAGESYFNANNYAAAVPVYLKSAYQHPAHKKSRDAAYGAILSFRNTSEGLALAQLLKESTTGGSDSRMVEATNRGLQQELKLSLKFAETFPEDSQTPALLANAANLQYQSGAYLAATESAGRIVANKRSQPSLKKTAYLLMANAYYEQQKFVLAEENFKLLMPLLVANDAELRGNVLAKLSASIYKQAEAAAAAGNWEQAVDTYIRLTHETPNSEYKVNALYDASAELLKHQQWQRAIPLMVEFKQEFPNHRLTNEISDKLVIAYLESGNGLFAADALLTLANEQQGTEKARKALYQSAELFQESGRQDQAAMLFKRYQNEYPKPVGYAIEAAKKLSDYYAQNANVKAQQEWLQKIIEIDRSAKDERSDRTLFLAAEASLWFAEDDKQQFDRIKLTQPLKASMAKKRQALTTTVDAYQRTAAYGVAEFRTQAAYRLAEIYGQLSKDLLGSAVPAGLDELQQEQYTILLEEQAYPFEEKSIELHEINIKNTRDGIYDKWVQKSYAELARIFPARYSREVSVIDYAENAY